MFLALGVAGLILLTGTDLSSGTYGWYGYGYSNDHYA